MLIAYLIPNIQSHAYRTFSVYERLYQMCLHSGSLIRRAGCCLGGSRLSRAEGCLYREYSRRVRSLLHPRIGPCELLIPYPYILLYPYLYLSLLNILVFRRF